MTQTDVADQASPMEDFEALLEESFISQQNLEGTVVKGTVIAVEGDAIVVDVGLKTEGRIQLREFAKAGEEKGINVGDVIDVYLERIENALGDAVLSRDKARREEAWNVLEVAFADVGRVEGQIVGRVKGGFTVDLSGAMAFLPGSQVDIRPVRDIGPLLGVKQPFQILKMDRRRGNIVVSRRAVLEETRTEQRSELVANLKEGQVHEGVVKNITDYGAFVDLGGIDGLLHVTDMSWRRVGHPTEVVAIGQTLKVQIIRVNPETQRISLGMKQLEQDPWEGIEAKYPRHTRFKGRVTNITDYGAFVELEPGVEGLVHISEMSYTKKNVHPGKIVSTSQEVEVMVLEVDPEKRRISLGLKQCMDNPWVSFSDQYPVGSAVEGEIKNITEFGLFMGLSDDVDGMVHLSDLDWNRSGEEAIAEYKKGDMIKAKVLDFDVEKERISLGIKQLADDPFQATDELRRGNVVTCTVAAVVDNGIEVTVGSDVKGFIRRSDLSRDRIEQKPERFSVGDKVDAQITNIDRGQRRVVLSIKAREIREEKEAVAQYGSTDSGASLGDILGAAMNRARRDAEEGAEADAMVESEPEPAADETEAEAVEADAVEAEAVAAEAVEAEVAEAATSEDADETPADETSADEGAADDEAAEKKDA
ncbi:MAG: 30S ribosomal protein S1 [Alphaproteobacteria bacterium]|nr:30S ribosomal protein S1 [Alphaproteobacteria bacterium]